MDIRPLTGEPLGAMVDDLARLRIAVFRDWPYLYTGNLDAERRYLEGYADTPSAIVVGAFDGPRLVGAATGRRLADDAAEVSASLAGTPYQPAETFYCAESMLLPDYRRRGIGHAFFDLREAHARALGLRHAAFCAVLRASDHPARPEGYWQLDPFWRARGYEPLPGLTTQFRWTDLGDSTPTAKQLRIWIRDLSGANPGQTAQSAIAG